MTGVTREQISVAFFNLIAGAADFTATSRRFVHWDQVNETQMPFLTMLKTGEQRGRQSEGLPTLTINAHVFVYMSAGMDPEDVPDTAMNALLDAIDAAVAPSGADALNGNKQTLGGLVSPIAIRSGRCSSIPATSTARPSPRSRSRFWFRRAQTGWPNGAHPSRSAMGTAGPASTPAPLQLAIQLITPLRALNPTLHRRSHP